MRVKIAVRFDDGVFTSSDWWNYAELPQIGDRVRLGQDSVTGLTTWASCSQRYLGPTAGVEAYVEVAGADLPESLPNENGVYCSTRIWFKRSANWVGPTAEPGDRYEPPDPRSPEA